MFISMYYVHYIFIIFSEINRVLDTVAQKMQLDFSQKLGATDSSVRETFNKHLKGKVRHFSCLFILISFFGDILDLYFIYVIYIYLISLI